MLCWIESDLVNKTWKNYLERVINQNFFTIFTEKFLSNYVLKRCKGNISYKSFIWNTTAQTGIHITVLSCSFFSKCVEDTFVIGQISDH